MSTPHGVPLEEAADRVSAYVYGNILLLAALVVLSQNDVRNGVGLAIVTGTAVTTFVAHTYAERLGAAVRGAGKSSWRAVLRDSLPILWAAAVPAIVMAIGSQGWWSPNVCLRIAEGWVVIRIAITGFIVGRQRGLPVTFRTWLASAALAAAAVAIVALKVLVSY